MRNVGYAYLHAHLARGVLPPRCPARVRPVTRLMRLEEELAVPSERAPADDDPRGLSLWGAATANRSRGEGARGEPAPIGPYALSEAHPATSLIAL